LSAYIETINSSAKIIYKVMGIFFVILLIIIASIFTIKDLKLKGLAHTLAEQFLSLLFVRSS
jgi:hypothetical protein